MRAAKRLGHDYETIVKACESGAETNSSKSTALLDAVPDGARGSWASVLCRLHWLLGHDDVAAAAKLVAKVSGEELESVRTPMNGAASVAYWSAS